MYPPQPLRSCSHDQIAMFGTGFQPREDRMVRTAPASAAGLWSVAFVPFRMECEIGNTRSLVSRGNRDDRREPERVA